MANQRKIFIDIYDKYVNQIFRFILLKVESKEIAEDLCSDVFTRGWRSIKNGTTIENPQAFFYKTAKNLIADHYRDKSKIRTVDLSDYKELADPKTSLEQKIVTADDIVAVKKVLINLKEDYQDVIIWHYLDELSTSEIAKISNKSEGAVRVMLHRALKALRVVINEA